MDRKVLYQYGLLLVTICIMAALAELVLRVLLPAPVIWKFPQESYTHDSETGHVLIPNQNAYTHDKPVTTNSGGQRDKDFPIMPAQGVVRIVAIGDSQTFGNGLDLDDTWPKQLEKLLNSGKSSRLFEVVNAGLPASDSWQHEVLIRRMIDGYKPHAVVLGFYVNDFSLRPEIAGMHLRNDADKPNMRLIYFLKRSALLLSLKSSWNIIKQAMFPSAGFRLENQLVEGVDTPETAPHWNQVTSSLVAMKAVADENNVDFIVMLLPRRDQVTGHVDAGIYNHRIEQILGGSGIRYINMYEPFRDLYAEAGQAMFIAWDGHNSAITNKVIAEELSGMILTVASLPSHRTSVQ